MKIPTHALISELHRTQPYTLIVVMALVWYASWSYLNHAMLADLTTLRTEMAHEIQMVSDRSIGNAELLDKIWGITLAAEIRAQQAVLCNVTKGVDRKTLRRSLDLLQEEHFRVTGRYYRLEPTCGLVSSKDRFLAPGIPG